MLDAREPLEHATPSLWAHVSLIWARASKCRHPASSAGWRRGTRFNGSL